MGAVTELRDDRIRGEFLESNRKAAAALSDYAVWLERQRFPKATADFALGAEKFRRFLAETELVDLPPEKILELGMAQLKKEQAGPGAAMAALPHAEGSVGGCLVLNIDARPSETGPLLYLNADGRLDEALNAVEKHGGRVLSARHSIAPFGFRAIVLDSEGNRIALHSM